jgi:hypothetical protein
MVRTIRSLAMNFNDKTVWFLLGWACCGILVFEILRELELLNLVWLGLRIQYYQALGN